jgi:hypothetical protein
LGLLAGAAAAGAASPAAATGLFITGDNGGQRERALL